MSKPDEIRKLRDDCAKADVPFFFKQWGEWLPDCNADDFDPDHLNHCRQHRWSSRGDDVSYRVGRKSAGRLLDGRLHDELPWGSRQ